jgi:hypothetical protein
MRPTLGLWLFRSPARRLTTDRLTAMAISAPVAGRAAASAFTSYGHPVPWALGSNGRSDSACIAVSLQPRLR